MFVVIQNLKILNLNLKEHFLVEPFKFRVDVLHSKQNNSEMLL